MLPGPTHYTSGVAGMTYLKAVEAGVDVIDTAMSPLAMGTSPRHILDTDGI